MLRLLFSIVNLILIRGQLAVDSTNSTKKDLNYESIKSNYTDQIASYSLIVNNEAHVMIISVG